MSLLIARRRAFTVIFLLMVLMGLLGPLLAQAQAQAPHVLVLNVDGIINPVKHRFIARALEQAEIDQTTLLIIELDTPGGLLTSTRDIVGVLLVAPVPVAVYVTPQGARAGSAGTFITAAANFAVMAPSTNIGAATPVSATGEDIPETLASKVENDAAALIRNIAEKRGRNQDKLEETVREAASFTASEAVELNVVDFIAEDLDDLLAQLDGLEAETANGVLKLATRDIEQRRFGRLGLVVELFNPGLIAPGVIGVICLLLAFLALGNLPVNWAGVVFVFVAIALAVLETQVSGFGILGIGAIVSFVIGGLLLFSQFGDVSPTLPPVSVSLWLIGAMAATFALALLFVVKTIYQSRRAIPQVAATTLVGATGAAISDLAPRGLVRLGDQTWTAISGDGTVIAQGEPVRVIEMNGLILTVSRLEETNI